MRVVQQSSIVCFVSESLEMVHITAIDLLCLCVNVAQTSVGTGATIEVDSSITAQSDPVE